MFDSRTSRPHISMQYGPDMTLLAREAGMHLVTHIIETRSGEIVNDTTHTGLLFYVLEHIEAREIW